MAKLNSGTRIYGNLTIDTFATANAATLSYLTGSAGTGNIIVTANILPAANSVYNLGGPTQRFRSLYLSGNTIDLAGATIKTDAITGAIAIIPNPTASNPNPIGVVFSPAGTISTVATTAGVASGSAISTASNVATIANTSIFTNVNVTSTTTSTSTTTGALVVAGGAGIAGRVSAGNIVTTSGVYWANGAAYSSGSSGGMTYTTSTSAPVSPAAGNFWYDSSTDIKYQYINDGTSSSWVDQSFPTNYGNLTVANTLTVSGSIVGTATNANYASAANVSLYESVTATTTNATHYPVLSGITTGNTASFTASTLTFNPSTGALSVTALSVGAITSSGTVIASTVNAGTIGNSGATLTGTISTAAQTNITSVGTLTSLNVGTINSSGTITGKTNTGGNVAVSNDSGTLSIRGDTTNAAVISFHRPSLYAINMGLDTDNTFKIGGWSDGASTYRLQVTSAGALTLTGGITTTGNIVPSANLTYNLGSTTAWWNNVYGVSIQAKYADLAEHYTADDLYGPGTVVVFGGSAEITVSDVSHDPRVAGVISTNPAYLMNAANAGLPVALTGRVPCQVQGPVAKGDRLVNIDTGVAGRLDPALHEYGCIVGKSLGEIADDSIQTIEIVVGRF
jgi:hypothetical protein